MVTDVQERDPTYTDFAWTYLSNHAYVLICIYKDPYARVHDLADQVGLSDRAVQGIIKDLIISGVISSAKHGRRNRYFIHPKKPLRHPAASECKVEDLLQLFDPDASLYR